MSTTPLLAEWASPGESEFKRFTFHHADGRIEVWMMRPKPFRWPKAKPGPYRTEDDVADYQAITCFPEWEEPPYTRSAR